MLRFTTATTPRRNLNTFILTALGNKLFPMRLLWLNQRIVAEHGGQREGRKERGSDKVRGRRDGDRVTEREKRRETKERV